METAARYVALLVVLTIPATMLFWFLIHPLVRLWRRMKLRPWQYYLLVTLYLLLGMAATWPFRGSLLRVSFGVRWPLMAVAGMVAAWGLYVGILTRRRLPISTLVGTPEVCGDGTGRLVREGIYAHVRHPRYVELVLAMTALSLFCNYLAVWILLALFVPAIYGVVLLEERELKQRFGRQYEQYCRDVPRFVPRLRRR